MSYMSLQEIDAFIEFIANDTSSAATLYVSLQELEKFVEFIPHLQQCRMRHNIKLDKFVDFIVNHSSFA